MEMDMQAEEMQAAASREARAIQREALLANVQRGQATGLDVLVHLVNDPDIPNDARIGFVRGIPTAKGAILDRVRALTTIGRRSSPYELTLRVEARQMLVRRAGTDADMKSAAAHEIVLFFAEDLEHSYGFNTRDAVRLHEILERYWGNNFEESARLLAIPAFVHAADFAFLANRLVIAAIPAILMYLDRYRTGPNPPTQLTWTWSALPLQGGSFNLEHTIRDIAIKDSAASFDRLRADILRMVGVCGDVIATREHVNHWPPTHSCASSASSRARLVRRR